MPAHVARLTVVALIALSLALPMSKPRPRLVADETTTATQVAVQITTITPLSPGENDTLRITGRVAYKSGPELSQVQVSLHIGRAVASRTELHDLRAQPVAQDLFGEQQTLGDGKLSPGSSLSFVISTPISALQLPYAGVYPMQVTAIGQPSGAARQVDLATTSTFLPYVPTEQASPATPLAWLVPLTADPALLADGRLTGDTSPSGTPVVTSVSAGGRLRGMLDALGSADAATATLDPATLHAISVSATGRYGVSGTNKTYPASRDAQRWLADLKSSDELDFLGVPYADTDVEAVLRDDKSPLLNTAVTRGNEILKAGLGDAISRLTPTIAVPPGGAVDTAGVRYYTSTTQAKALVLNASAVPQAGDNPSASAAVPNLSPRLLLSDQTLTSLTTAGPGSNFRLAEQEVIAELAEAHLEDRFAGAPTEGGAITTARPLLIAPSTAWTPSPGWLKLLLADTGKLSWVQQTPVKDLLRSPAEPRAGLQYPGVARVAELPAATVDASAQVTAATSQLFPAKTPAGITTQPRTPESITTPIRDTALSVASSRWRGQPEKADLLLTSAAGVVKALQSRVRVVASPQVTLTSKSGRVPVTLENDLDAAVDVSLVLTSLDKSRVSSDTVVRRTVRAGQKVQVEVEVKAASAGTFPVRLALYSQDGLPLGAPAQVLVRSTTYGVVATIFTIVALSLLGLAVLVRAARKLIQRARKRSGPAAA
jgi:hypothetical protein